MATSRKSSKSSKTASKTSANLKKKPLKDLPSVKASKVLGGQAFL